MTDTGKRNIKNWIEGSNMFDKEARNYVKNMIDKDIAFKLTNQDEDTGICKCGRVTEIIDGEYFCLYCGQKIMK